MAQARQYSAYPSRSEYHTHRTTSSGSALPHHLREGLATDQPDVRGYSSSRYDPQPYKAPRFDPYARPAEAVLASNPRRLPSTPRDPNHAYNAQSGSGYTVGKSGITSRYQPSRGAQRDAKTSQRYALAAPQPVVAHPIPSVSKGYDSRYSSRYSPPSHRHIGGRERDVHEAAAQQYSASLALQQRQQQHAQHREREQQQQHARQLAVQQQQMQQASQYERIRLEQQAAIAAARRAHAAEIEEKQVKAQQVEEERKTRRIQLQVFVHARPTACQWKSCHAVLNSWALLEKHIYHAHLHPGARGLPATPGKEIKCEWEGCGETFKSAEQVYKHVLIPHMRPFSARCPFNCLFEGDHFTSLMAHIGRRHPQATPNDFVPGLIHFKPTLSSPPPLPGKPNATASGKIEYLCSTLKGYEGEISNKTKRTVQRGCFSGKHPRKDDYADRKGAMAAISAIIENSKRMNMAISGSVHGEEGEMAVVPGTAGLPSASSVGIPNSAISLPDLLDVKRTLKEAKDQAKKEVIAEVADDVDEISSSSESGNSEGSEYKASRSVKAKLEVDNGGVSTKAESIGGEEGEIRNFKRSERLRRKLENRVGSERAGWASSTPTTPTTPTKGSTRPSMRGTSIS